MKKYITFEEFRILSWPEKQGFLRGFDVSDKKQDDQHLYHLAMARIIMDEDYDVLKRLANS